jgi:double-stranded uracil-DNA glycosylase
MDDVLPDVLAPGLAVVFCGNAAGKVSARRGAYYAGPGNCFWPVLHEVGLTPVRLAPEEFRRLPEFGLGLTDACKASFGSDAEVGTAGHDRGRLERSIRRVAPRNLAFVGKRAAQTILGHRVEYGRQRTSFAATTTWVLPSTSGLARRFWTVEPWRELAQAVTELAFGGEMLESQPEPQKGLGRAVGELRRRAGLDQAALAEAADLPPASVARLESGQEDPTWGDMRRIAAVLGVSLEALSELAEAHEES